MTPLRIPLGMSLSEIGQPPGTWTPGTTPGGTTPLSKVYTAIKLSYPPDHKTRAGKLASKDIRYHVRVEDSATAAEIGGTTSTKTVDDKGLIYPETSSVSTSITKYVSITPLDQIPDGPKINEAMTWRYPIEFSAAPKVTEIWLEPGGGVQPTFPGAPKRAVPITPSKPGAKPGEETDWLLIAGIGVAVLGAGFLVYQLVAGGGKSKADSFPVPEEI